MAGHFELIPGPEGNCTVKLVDGHGKEIATSVPFKDSNAAVDAIDAFRTIAAAAPIRDRTKPRRRSGTAGTGDTG